MSRFEVDGQRRPRPAPMERLRLIGEDIPQPEVYESDDTGWQTWDDAVRTFDGVVAQHERAGNAA